MIFNTAKLFTKEKISFDEATFEHLIGKTPKEIIIFMQRNPDAENVNEWIYVLQTYFWGLYKKNLHLFFNEGKVIDYYIFY